MFASLSNHGGILYSVTMQTSPPGFATGKLKEKDVYKDMEDPVQSIRQLQTTCHHFVDLCCSMSTI